MRYQYELHYDSWFMSDVCVMKLFKMTGERKKRIRKTGCIFIHRTRSLEWREVFFFLQISLMPFLHEIQLWLDEHDEKMHFQAEQWTKLIRMTVERTNNKGYMDISHVNTKPSSSFSVVFDVFILAKKRCSSSLASFDTKLQRQSKRSTERNKWICIIWINKCEIRRGFFDRPMLPDR